jgi:hypothetical protein
MASPLARLPSRASRWSHRPRARAARGARRDAARAGLSSGAHGRAQDRRQAVAIRPAAPPPATRASTARAFASSPRAAGRARRRGTHVGRRLHAATSRATSAPDARGCGRRRRPRRRRDLGSAMRPNWRSSCAAPRGAPAPRPRAAVAGRDVATAPPGPAVSRRRSRPPASPTRPPSKIGAPAPLDLDAAWRTVARQTL